MRRHLSARSRLTLLYASLFTLRGTALVLITYVLVADTLDSTTATRIPPPVRQAIAQCVQGAQTRGAPAAGIAVAAVPLRRISFLPQERSAGLTLAVADLGEHVG